MRFSLRFNNDLPLPTYISLAQAAEAAGFDQFWVSNDLFFRSAPVILAAIGAATERTVRSLVGLSASRSWNPTESVH